MKNNQKANGWYDGKFFLEGVLVARVDAEFSSKGNFQAKIIELGLEVKEKSTYFESYTAAKEHIEKQNSRS